MAAHAMHALIDGTSAIDMAGSDGGFVYVRGGRRMRPECDAASRPCFSDDLRIACRASGFSEFSGALRHGSSAGSDLLPSGMGACFVAGFASFAISLLFLLL